MNVFGYSDPVWRLFQETPRAGLWPANEAVTGEAGTPAGRSLLRLQVKMAGGTVVDARFQAYGCPTTIAVGAWLAQWAAGKTAADLRGLNAKKIREPLEIPESRAHCALLGEDVVKAVLKQLESR